MQPCVQGRVLLLIPSLPLTSHGRSKGGTTSMDTSPSSITAPPMMQHSRA